MEKGVPRHWLLLHIYYYYYFQNWSIGLAANLKMSGKVFCVCRLEFKKSRVDSWKDFSIFPEQLFLKFFFDLGKKVGKFKSKGNECSDECDGGSVAIILRILFIAPIPKFIYRSLTKPSTIGFGATLSRAQVIWFGLVTGVQYRQVIRFWVGRIDRMLLKYGGRGGGHPTHWLKPGRWMVLTHAADMVSGLNHVIPLTAQCREPVCPRHWVVFKQALNAEKTVLCWAETLPDRTERILRCFCLSCGGSWIARSGAEIHCVKQRIRVFWLLPFQPGFEWSKLFLH